MFSGAEAPTTPSAALAELETEHLEHRIVQLASDLTAGSAQLLALVCELDRRGAWAAWGCLSCAHWLSWRCALSLRAAREQVRTARALRELPEISAAFASGRLSYSKVRALTRVATPETEAELLGLARHATAAQLERIMRACARQSAKQAGDTHAGRYVSYRWEEDGSLSLQASLPPEQGAALLGALEAAREREAADLQAAHSERRAEREAQGQGSAQDAAPGTDQARCSAEHLSPSPTPGPDPAEPPVPRVARADALLRMAHDSMSGANEPPSTSAERTRVTVHVDLEGITAPSEPPPAGDERYSAAHRAARERPGDPAVRCHLAGGPGLASETARRLCCDASLLALGERQGEVVSVGRRTRVVPAAMRRAVAERDGGCTFPGCTHTRYTDAHHIRHWAHGGETSLANLTLLCPRHHRSVHEGGFALGRDEAGVVRFARPDGTPLPHVPAAPPATAQAPGRPGAAQQGDGLDAGSGERMDFDHVMFVAESRGWVRRA